MWPVTYKLQPVERISLRFLVTAPVSRNAAQQCWPLKPEQHTGFRLQAWTRDLVFALFEPHCWGSAAPWLSFSKVLYCYLFLSLSFSCLKVLCCWEWPTCAPSWPGMGLHGICCLLFIRWQKPTLPCSFTSSLPRFFLVFFLIDFCSFRERFQCQVSFIDVVTEHTFLCILKTFFGSTQLPFSSDPLQNQVLFCISTQR